MKKTGGYAFPHNENLPIKYSGMTLRDYFAGQALMGMCTNLREIIENSTYARIAYEIADAMLEARDRN